jgi:hypothetical protein
MSLAVSLQNHFKISSKSKRANERKVLKKASKKKNYFEALDGAR